jgi:hypothetical protein
MFLSSSSCRNSSGKNESKLKKKKNPDGDNHQNGFVRLPWKNVTFDISDFELCEGGDPSQK